MKVFDHITAVNQAAAVEPHARRLEDAANQMEAAGIGCAIDGGHVAVLRRMAANLRASAAHGELPSVYHDQMHASSEPAPLPVATVDILSQLGL